jgi:hypothetical protein
VLRQLTVGDGAGASDSDHESHFCGFSDSGVYAGLGSVSEAKVTRTARQA